MWSTVCRCGTGAVLGGSRRGLCRTGGDPCVFGIAGEAAAVLSRAKLCHLRLASLKSPLLETETLLQLCRGRLRACRAKASSSPSLLGAGEAMLLVPRGWWGMRSSGRDWAVPGAGVELYWDVLGIVKTPCARRMLLQGMFCYGVGDLRHPWETPLGPSLTRLWEKLSSKGSWMSREVFIEWFGLETPCPPRQRSSSSTCSGQGDLPLDEVARNQPDLEHSQRWSISGRPGPVSHRPHHKTVLP